MQSYPFRGLHLKKTCKINVRLCAYSLCSDAQYFRDREKKGEFERGIFFLLLRREGMVFFLLFFVFFFFLFFFCAGGGKRN